MGDCFLLFIGVIGFSGMSIRYFCNKKKTLRKKEQMPAQIEYVEIMSP